VEGCSVIVRYKCLGGPKNKQYIEDQGPKFQFMDSRSETHTYAFDEDRGVYVCQTKEEPKWDFDFYAVAAPELRMSKIVAEAPIIRFGDADVRFLTLEWIMEWDLVDSSSHLIDLEFMTVQTLKGLIGGLRDPKNSPRQWREGERELAFQRRQPPVTPEDVAEEAAFLEKGNETD
jgi:hypothetical protein